MSYIRPSYSTTTAGVFMVAKHYQIDPAAIFEWPYRLFIDALENLQVLAEVDRVRQRLMDKS